MLGADFSVLRENITQEALSNMTEAYVSKNTLVWVKDNKGNECVCHLSQLKDPRKAPKEEFPNCVDSGSAAYDPGS